MTVSANQPRGKRVDLKPLLFVFSVTFSHLSLLSLSLSLSLSLFLSLSLSLCRCTSL